MNGYNFTDRVRKVLQMAREEAARLHHEFIGTEHILLALVREGQGIAAAVLTNLNVDLKKIRDRVEQLVKKGKPGRSSGPDLPYTGRAKKILELAMSEARELHHSYVGTEHLLLGTLAEEQGIGAQVLTEAGVTLDAARDETARLVGNQMSSESVVQPRYQRRTALLQKMSELANRLIAEPPPSPGQAREIGTELQALAEELRALL